MRAQPAVRQQGRLSSPHAPVPKWEVHGPEFKGWSENRHLFNSEELEGLTLSPPLLPSSVVHVLKPHCSL